MRLCTEKINLMPPHHLNDYSYNPLSCSYIELEEQVKRWSRRLKEAGVKKHSIVAIYMAHSVEVPKPSSH